MRTAVLELWRAVQNGWPRSDELAARILHRHPQLKDGQRDQIISLFHGMVVHVRKIERGLDRMNLSPVQARHRNTLAYGAFLLLQHWAEPAALASELAGDLANLAWFDPAAVEADLAAEADPALRLGLQAGLPEFLATRLIQVFGPERATAIAAALAERPPQTLRANTLKTTREGLIARLKATGIETSATPHAAAGVTLKRRSNPFRLAAFREGLFEMQDESSQLAAEVVAPPPGGLVVDFCAGAGGKTLALGALMRNRGRLIALDTQGFKLPELRKRAARAGLSNLQALPMGLTDWPPEVAALRGKAARVLVDVPCSGTGALRRNPEARWRLQPEDLIRLPELQFQIARRAMALVAPGGRLIYATCSILPEENEAVIARLLQAGNAPSAGTGALVADAGNADGNRADGGPSVAAETGGAKEGDGSGAPPA
ncbi:MAG: RsmB/NOP family class I SAM-dependent RNA methyltransferase, partial [Planctomycetota bacterium]